MHVKLSLLHIHHFRYKIKTKVPEYLVKAFVKLYKNWPLEENSKTLLIRWISFHEMIHSKNFIKSFLNVVQNDDENFRFFELFENIFLDVSFLQGKLMFSMFCNFIKERLVNIYILDNKKLYRTVLNTLYWYHFMR